MKTIIVFGGTGSVGRIIVQKLIAANHSVKVLTRTPVTSNRANDFETITGNVLDADSVDSCIARDDLVIIALGFNNSTADTMSRGTQNVISAMVRNGSHTVVCLSAHGAGDSWDYMPDAFKEMVTNDPILNASFKDHALQEQIIMESGLDWTIVRPTEIVDSAESGDFLVNGYGENLRYQISKYDVAQFMVNEVLQRNHPQSVATITC